MLARALLAPAYTMLYSIMFLYTGFSLVLTSFFNGVGRTDVSLKVALIQLPAVVSITPILTLFFNVPGFIFSLIVSGTISLAYTASLAYKYGLRFNFKSIVRICAASLISSATTLPISLYLPSSHLVKLVLSSTTFILSYLTITPVIGAVEQRDIAGLISITRDIKPVSKFSKMILSYEELLLSSRLRHGLHEQNKEGGMST
jgi:hypothetical protein